MRGLSPRRQTPHPSESVSTGVAALSHRGRGRSNWHPRPLTRRATQGHNATIPKSPSALLLAFG
ncbi:hypothetical protein FXV83_04975 [Bradyrhizobium hipponense]|uniref:Uncharacterized protein n=1 Tax=Bradyrhizobium hipponense TaxID=2605638 RepID=A0A5S4YTG1_9BRAD|nr:hypothetical protein FXV83_04975 [Bradyrhizobium hipponense]